MGKKLFILAAAALTMTACSHDEIIEVNSSNSISFRTAVDTRASETATANLKDFYVSTLNEENVYMSNVCFSKEGDATEFTSSPSYNWPKNATLNFFAYAPSLTLLGVPETPTDGSTAMTISSTEKKLNNFSPMKAIGSQVDFITATAQGSETDNGNGKAVELTFGHRLAQIEIQAKNGSAYTYKIAGVKIARVKSKGSFDFTNLTWTLTDDAIDSYVNCYSEVITLTESAQKLTKDEVGNAMLLPQNLSKWEQNGTTDNEGTYIAVLVNVLDSDNEQIYPVGDNANGKYNWVAVGIETNWVAGNKYVYTLDFSTGGGLVAPGHGGNVDPENDINDENKDNDPSGENPDTGDNLQPGEELIGGPITFTATVTEWTSAPESSKM